MGSVVLLLALFLISVVLGADAWRSREEEMNYLRENHPERFDIYIYGRFIPYKTGRVYRPNLPINPQKFENM